MIDSQLTLDIELDQGRISVLLWNRMHQLRRFYLF
jgi:hypothetical protein